MNINKAMISMLVLLLLFASQAAAATSVQVPSALQQSVVLYIGSPDAYVKGVKKKVDSTNENVTPLIRNGYTLVPVRFVSEQLGAQVTWIPADQSVIIKKGDSYAHMSVGFATIIANGEMSDLEVGPQIIEGRTYLPLRAAVEALQMQVTWYNGLIMIGETSITAGTYKAQLEQLIADLSPIPAEQASANIMSNTDGPGNVVLHDGYVYYNDGFSSGGTLYKFKYGQEAAKKALVRESTVDLNVDSGWIYYIVPNRMGGYGGKNPIKKMKTDGTQRQTVISDNEITDLVVEDGWMYYTSYNYSASKVSLYRAKTDGTGKKLLYEGYEDYADVPASKKGVPSDVHIEGGRMYLLIKKACGYSKTCSTIYKMNTDGTQRQAIHASEYAVSMQIVGSTVYYARFPEQLRDDSADSVSIDVYSMTLDGKNKRAVPAPFDESRLYFMENFKVRGSWIYFDVWGTLYKMQLNGMSLTKIADYGNVQHFDLVGDWLYVQGKSNAYRVKTDGTHAESLNW